MNLSRNCLMLRKAFRSFLLSQRGIITSKIKIDERSLTDIDKEFKDIPKENKTKQNFMAAIEFFRASRGAKGRGHVEFINAALKNLEEFNLHKDLDTYKALLNIFPKGPLLPTNIFQKMFLHFPVQQVCAVGVLDEMEWHGVQIDKETHDIVVNVFGGYSFAGKKAKRMMYWLPKLKHTNHYLDRRDVEHRDLSDLELARTALKMICRDAGTVLTNVKVKVDETHEDHSPLHNRWIVSAQSPLQRWMIREMVATSCSSSPKAVNNTLYVDGPFFVYVMNQRVEYAVLSAPPRLTADDEFIDQRSFHDYPTDLHRQLFDLGPRHNMHEQSDQTILALCVMEEPTQRMAMAWLNHLQSTNPTLRDRTVLFRIQESPSGGDGDKCSVVAVY